MQEKNIPSCSLTIERVSNGFVIRDSVGRHFGSTCIAVTADDAVDQIDDILTAEIGSQSFNCTISIVITRKTGEAQED